MSAIRVSKELGRLAKREAELMSRSAAAQIEHWASIGRAVESCMSALEIKALLARVSYAGPDNAVRPSFFPAVGEVDGEILYQARIKQLDPMPGLIASVGDAQVVQVNQSELQNAKRARQLVDYSVQRERIIPWKAVSRFAGAKIKANFRKVPLES